MGWEMYKASLIGKIDGNAKYAFFYGRDYKEALQRIIALCKEYDDRLEQRIKESEAKLNG